MLPRRLLSLLPLGALLVTACAVAPVAEPRAAGPISAGQPAVVATPAAPSQDAAAAPAAPTATPLPAPTDQPAPVPPQAPAQPQATPEPAAVANATAAIPITTQPPADNAPCDDTARPDPLPPPGSPGREAFFRSFRQPLAPAPLFDPPPPRHVGLQAGHWLNDQVPPELGRLQAGSSGGGKQEWQVNLDVAQRTAALLEADGMQVDVLPATVPSSYHANVFVALHADGDPSGQDHGFKVARPGFSSVPDVDDQLVDALTQAYAGATGLPRDDEHISLRMRYYYAFNSRRYCHAVAPGVPQAIIEMGYLTNAGDRQYLIGQPDRLARGLADGIEAFLQRLP